MVSVVPETLVAAATRAEVPLLYKTVDGIEVASHPDLLNVTVMTWLRGTSVAPADGVILLTAGSDTTVNVTVFGGAMTVPKISYTLLTSIIYVSPYVKLELGVKVNVFVGESQLLAPLTSLPALVRKTALFLFTSVSVI